MVSKRQRVVNNATIGVDAELAAFIADVIELAGSFRRLAEGIASADGLTQTLWYGLSVFSGTPTTVAQAARRLGTSRQALQRTTNELIARDLVATEPNPDHRASPFVVLTPAGTKALARVTATASSSRRGWFADADLDGLRIAHAEVRRLRDALRVTPPVAQQD